MRVPPQAVLSLVLLAAPAYAVEAPSAAPKHLEAAGDKSSASIARIAFVSGKVAIYQLGQTDWTGAAVDLRVASGDWLATDPQGRVEIRVRQASIDLASDTQINLAALREQIMQIALSRGRLNVHLREFQKGESDEIDLPGGAVWLTTAGTYDVTVGTAGGRTRIAVFEGKARFAGSGLDQTIQAGDALVLQQAGANLTASVERAIPDEFAGWARSRDNNGRQLSSADPAQRGIGAMSGSSEPENTSEAENAAAPAAHRARAQRHRRLARHHYVRSFHRRSYGYGYAVRGPAPVTPFSLFNSLLSVVR
jgi:hypothetical protein